MDLVPGQQVERYVVESRIGAGSMTSTYRVLHTTLNTLHVLSVPNHPRRSLHRAMVAGARIQARLRHQNVIAATDVLEMDGGPAVVLDHVEGPSLEDFVHSHELEERSIDALASGLFEAVGFLHGNGIVHRNFKHRTVIVDLGGNVAVPRVTDFTIARMLGKPQRKRDAPRVFGTAEFMSPEQTRDSDDVDHRADIWSLGCVLYFLCTGGALPFSGEHQDDIFAAVRSGAYLPLRRFVPSAPERWVDAIRHTLVVDPLARAGSAEEVANRWFAGASERPALVSRVAPVGQVALVFTDIQGSTQLWEHDQELARHSLRAHDAVMRTWLHRHGGYEVKTEGDSFMVAFHHPSRAIRFCLDVQRALHEHPWSDDLLTVPIARVDLGFRGLRVRMGVHVGEPEARARGDRVDYFGPMVNRAARIAAAGHGGQILVSREAWELAAPRLREDHENPCVADLGHFELRGLAEHQHILQLLPENLADRSFPPVKADRVA